MGKKAVIVVIMISIIFVSLLFGMQVVKVTKANFFPDPGPDLPRIYIRSDGSVDPATAPIQKEGNLYQLVGDITLNTIEIQRDNIVLDGSGHQIQGNASWMGTVPRFDDAGNNGIIILGRHNITITRLSIEKCATGVRIFNSSRIDVVDNWFINETAAMYNPLGVAIKDASFVLVENNTFSHITGSAIACNGTYNTISGNTITDVSGSMYGNIHLEGWSNLVSNNEIEAMVPLTLDEANSNIISNNEISGPKTSSAQDASQERAGGEGIALFSGCSDNMIAGNNVTGFVNQAIRTVFNCTNNTIFGNYLANNGFAVALQDGAVGNIFYGNTFAIDSCKVQIDDGVKGTSWDNGTIGNFWGDYDGTDGNGDGIGDSPYIVYGFRWDNNISGFVSFTSGQDDHPLMKPANVSDSVISISSSSTESPSPSPTQQPTIQPSITASLTPSTETDNPNLVLEMAGVIVLVIVVVGLLVYFRKRRG